MHIDATIVPLAPGTLLVNPERNVPNALFRDWDIIVPGLGHHRSAQVHLPDDWPMYFCSSWVNMNVLSLDPCTVVVESPPEWSRAWAQNTLEQIEVLEPHDPPLYLTKYSPFWQGYENDVGMPEIWDRPVLTVGTVYSFFGPQSGCAPTGGAAGAGPPSRACAWWRRPSPPRPGSTR